MWVILVGLATGLSFWRAQAESVSSPDVYLITIDTLRADHVHCYGDNQIATPALDGLAQDGIRFAQAFTPSPITNTSHVSILTGLLPSAHGVTNFGLPLAKEHATWAELLQSHGYETAAFIGAVILDTHTLAPGMDRGFDYYDNFPQAPHAAGHWGGVERRGGDVVHRAESWMNKHPGKQRFIWVHLYDPHDPYEPPAPYSHIYQGRLYDGEIAYADAALGNLLDYLKRHNRYRNALIVVVGDHGEGLGEHGEETHGIFLYNSTTHVPLIVKLPIAARSRPPSPGSPGRIIDAAVQTTDILPAVLDLLGIARPAVLAGASLPLHLDANDLPQQTIFAETDYPLRFGWAPLRAVSASGFKLIEAPRPEFYNLASDPHELSNAYEPWNENVKALRRLMAASALRPPGFPHGSGNPGSETLEELRALGYLGAKDEHTSTDVPELSSLPDPKDEIEQQNLLHSAMLLVSENRPAEAKSLLEKVLLLDPSSAPALQTLGDSAMQAGQYREAAGYFEQLRKANPSDASASWGQAQALYKLEDWPGARDALEAAANQSTWRGPARLLLAKVYLKLNQREAAEDQLEAETILAPGNVEALLDLAELYLADKKYRDVVELLQQKVNAPDSSPRLFTMLARAYQGLGDTAEAEKIKKLSTR